MLVVYDAEVLPESALVDTQFPIRANFRFAAPQVGPAKGPAHEALVFPAARRAFEFAGMQTARTGIVFQQVHARPPGVVRAVTGNIATVPAGTETSLSA